MKLHAVAFVALAAFAFPAVAGAGKVYLDYSVPKVGSTQVTINVRKPAAFKVLLRTSTQGRTKLFLLGKHAPKGGALIDTKTYACEGAAGSFYCKGSYESLPAGTYTFKVVHSGTGPQSVHIELTVRW